MENNRNTHLVLAHRGFHFQEPENTLAAFYAAVEIGAHGIETDVQIDKYKRPILFHDRILSDGRKVRELSRQELSTVMGYNVPELVQALDAIPSILWNLEIKDMEAIKPTIEVLKAFAGKRRILVSSFFHQAVDVVVRQLNLPGALLVSHCPNGALLDPSLLAPGIESIVWDCGAVNNEALKWAMDVGLQNIVYGFQSRTEHEPFLCSDVTAIITDFPDAVLE